MSERYDLSHLLRRAEPRPVMVPYWYEDHGTLVGVLAHAVDTGELTTAQEVVDVVEKPWHYPELHTAWLQRDGLDVRCHPECYDDDGHSDGCQHDAAEAGIE
jgi:hypothetical protein